MTDAHMRLVDAIIAELLEQEGMAQELAEFADRMEADGHHATVDTLRAISRGRRVKGIELRSNLAALEVASYDAAEDGN
ncbi:hypothetical protein FF100_28380 [Methylobacterium terricola]|uniref:Uncharacterized protein n=1 Tax=Methylobacterium terricola TaxID=2583531 RepID=A0A5C4L9G6_9HYPH|nr:hypothetical protein [Methylobacterium terricola]TNC08759.1 hypothetical protein FF100_28380 [Methylobacterium terricola]